MRSMWTGCSTTDVTLPRCWDFLEAVTPQVDCDAAIAYFDILAQAHGFGTSWCGFLKIIVDTIPEVADIFGIPRGAPFYAMLFGNPAVDYVRCVDRSSAAKIVYQ